MSQRLWKHGIIPAFVLVLAVTSCEYDSRSPTEPFADPQAGLFDSLLGGSDDGADESEGEFTHLQGHPPALDGISQTVSQVIGVEGGSLNLSGHTLIVPAGSVVEPVLFSMTVPRNGYVEVELEATLVNEVWNLTTGLVDGLLGLVGADLFETVTLELTYAWAKNAPAEPNRLVILHLLDDDGDHDGAHEVVEEGRELDETRKVLRVKLDHFSRYCMAF